MSRSIRRRLDSLEERAGIGRRRLFVLGVPDDVTALEARRVLELDDAPGDVLVAIRDVTGERGWTAPRLLSVQPIAA